MDVLASAGSGLRGGSQAQIIQGRLERVLRIFLGVFIAVLNASKSIASVSNMATRPQHHIERCQHIRSIAFAYTRGHWRPAFVLAHTKRVVRR
jgi:hypothetical protein